VRATLLLPLLLLLVVALVSVLTIIATRRQRRLQRRVESVVPSARDMHPVAQRDLSLRVRRSGTDRMNLLARLILMPMDLPLANLIAPVWIFAASVVATIVVIWFGHLLTGWYVASIEGLVAGLAVLRGTFGWEAARYRAKLVRQLPDAVQLVISATRAGLPVSEAFQAIAQEMASPTHDEFLRVVNEMALGVAADEALLNMHRRTGVTEYAIFAVTIGVQARSGGRLAETIQNLADTVRERLTIAARARALAGEAKVSAIIMAALPVVAGVMLAIGRPGSLDMLFTDPRGVHMFLFGLTTLILGAVTMRQMIRGATKD
jgi:tight adherence protein B